MSSARTEEREVVIGTRPEDLHVAPTDRPPVTMWMQVAAVVAASSIYLVNSTLPAIVEALSSSLKFDTAFQGAFASADYLGMMVGSLSAMVVMRYASPRWTVTAALLVLLATDLGSIVSRWSYGLLALRVAGGIGAGLGGGACYYVYGLKDPERMAGAASFGVNGLSLLAIAAMPVLTRDLGWNGIFLCVGVLTIPALIASRKFPTALKLPAAVIQSSAKARTASPTLESLRWVGLSGTAVGSFGMALFWSFLGRFGAEAGFTEQAISTGLSIGIVFACVGALLTVVFGERLRVKTFIATLLLTALGVAATSSSNLWAFSAAISAFTFGVAVYWVVAFGMMMRRAPTERFAVHLAGTQMTAYVAGPVIGGLIVERCGFTVLRWIGVSSFLLCGVCYLAYFQIAYWRGAKGVLSEAGVLD